MSRLYTYLPKDNTALTEGLLSTALSPKGFEKYRGRTGKYTKEDVLKALDSWEPEWTRSKAISALTQPIPPDAAEDFLNFAKDRKLYSFDTKDLIKAKILAHIRRARKGGGTDPVDDVKYERLNWHRKKKHLLFQGVPHYFIETKDGKVPPEFVRQEKKAQVWGYFPPAHSPSEAKAWHEATVPVVSKAVDAAGQAVADMSAGVNRLSEKLPAVRRAVTPWLYNNQTVKAVAPVADYALAKGQEGLASLTTRAQEARDRAWSQPGLGGWLKGEFYSGLSSLGSYAQPLLGGTRQFLATHLSDGGRNYTPRPNTEKMFSRDARRRLGQALYSSGGRNITSSFAYAGLPHALTTPYEFEALAPTGSMNTNGRNLTDVADMNINYQAGNAPYTETQINSWARAMLGAANTVGNTFAALAGSSDDPDAGKIHTKIPLNSLPGYSDLEQHRANLESLEKSRKDLEDFSTWYQNLPTAQIQTQR